MWAKFAEKVLKYRIWLLILLGIATAYMAWLSMSLEVYYGLPKMLPENDSTNLAYEKFIDRYGEGAVVYIIGIEENPLEDINTFNAWYELGQEIGQLRGVDTVVSVANILTLKKNAEEKKFEPVPIFNKRPKTQQELDSLRDLVYSLPFYKGRLYSDSTGASLMFVNFNRALFDSDDRAQLSDAIKTTTDRFQKKFNISVHYSGLPFIRAIITMIVESEMTKLVTFAMLTMITLLLIFFRSWQPIVIAVLIVALGVTWSWGSIVLFGYKVTILTALIAPLIIVIGVPNSIYLINRYHQEFKERRDKHKSLIVMVSKIGKATFLTNLTTAIGFATFVFTQSEVLQEFGVIAAFNIMCVFIISVLMIPIWFSFLDPPKDKHTRHLDKRWLNGIVEILVSLVEKHRTKVYIGSVLTVIIGIYGMTLMRTTGNLADDLPADHRVTTDLKFMERHFGGVMPFEISIDTKKKGGAIKDRTLRKINKLQNKLGEYPEFSAPLSIVEGVKFSKQAYYNGNEKKYALINNQERVFFKKYFESDAADPSWMESILDSNKQHTRISVFMADVGTERMDEIITDLRPRIDSIFDPTKFDVNLTGQSVVFLQGTNYLVKNLSISLSLAIFVIALFMAALFSSVRMVLVSMVTNFVPLLLAAAMMGYFGIAIKPSTILVFSIAFGISVDDTIHYLAKYREELKVSGWNITQSTIAALRETGVSMLYTSIILFFGFLVFTTSDFGGTQSMGVLVSFTLMVAMFSNLILLPSLLMTLDKTVTTRAFEEPFIYDDDEDIDVSQLELKKAENGISNNKAVQKNEKSKK